MRFKISLLLICLSSPLMAATDGLLSGSKLLERCSDADVFSESEPSTLALMNATNCYSYLTGYVNATQVYEAINPDAGFICVPEEVGTNQLSRVVVKYLEANPERLHEHMGVLVAEALRSGFPCQ